jgi:ATP-dependent RNA helicase DDX31/DBP7
MAAVILQRRFENTVAANKALLASAKSAFQSFLRAYSTHSAATKHIFQLRALHFGHVAKSFAMREPPSAIRVSGATVASASKPLKDSNKKKAKTPAPSGKFRKGSAVTGGKAAAEFAA